MKKLIQLENRRLRELINLINQKEGTINLNVHSSIEHEMVKCQIMYWLKKNGFDCFSEAEFNSGGRADIFCIKSGTGYAIEVMNFETEERLSEKVKKYPKNIEIIKVRTKDFDINGFYI